jgi:hypothetical protein
MTRIPVNPELLTWARKRAGLDALALAGQRRSGEPTSKEGTHE